MAENLDDTKNLFKDYGKEPVKEEPKKDLKYKDNDGKILYGYSQTDMDKNNKLMEKLVYLGWAFFIFVVVMTIYIIYNDVINNIVYHCMG